MVYAVRVHETGGPEVLKWEEIEVGAPGAGEIRIRQTAVGLNYLDTYFRSGLYPAPGGLPLIPGGEGAGVVAEVGPGVTEVAVGDRVAYTAPVGAYAEERVLAADRVVPLPDNIDDKTAAAMMLKGMTAQYLLRRTFRLEKGQTALFHAAAGGVGLIAGQWGNHLGVTMIGTVGSPAKADLARANGYAHAIDYTKEDFVERVRQITGGAGVNVVYDSIGKDTYPGSLDCLAPLGMWVSFGQASGPLPDINLGILAQKGSLTATRPTIFTYIAKRQDLIDTAKDLFDVVSSGAVKIAINQEYALADAAQAHRDLEARKTTGSTILVP